MKNFVKYIVFLLSIPFIVFLLNLYSVIHYSPKFNKRFVQDLILNDSLVIKGNYS